MGIFFLRFTNSYATAADPASVVHRQISNDQLYYCEVPSRIIKNIGLLAGIDDPVLPLRGENLRKLNALANAYLMLEDGYIADFGLMKDLSGKSLPKLVDDAQGGFLLPAWCDSHTHLVFAGWRDNEFVDKLNGLSYAEIAAKGGGIINSAKRVRETSEDALFSEAWKRLVEVSQFGTASIEIKSGYGLDVQSELKMLRVIKKLREKSSMNIKATLLAAHAYPPEFVDNHQGYIDSIIHEMIPSAVHEKLADYIDVFCEQGFFSPP